MTTRPQDESSAYEKHRRMLKLIRLMKGDVVTCLQDHLPMLVEGEGPLKALMTVIEVAEKVTIERLTPILGADGRSLADQCESYDSMHLENPESRDG